MKETLSNQVKITKIAQSKIDQVDFENVSFGKVFTDHMFVCHYKNGTWQQPEIVPYGPIQLDPSARVFHYGQAVFEGMKAYKDNNGDAFLFRPDENFRRINKSAERLAMPAFPEDYFNEGLHALLKLDNNWIKSGLGNSLYIRPFIIASETSLMASEANAYTFYIICSPVQSYYGGEVNVLISDYYSRSASGGIGFAKAAGNYAAQFYPTNLAKEKGYDQIIWTDSSTHTSVEEAGTMNIFFRINDTLLTAPTSERILDGITRKSIITMAEKEGYNVEVRDISVEEIVEAAKNGTLKEAFGAGTAAVVSVIKGIGYKDSHYDIPVLTDGYAQFFKKSLTDIQYNLSDDAFGWRVKIG
ncbi:branched-chain amino acid aminotransferase [Aquimarina agarivorans]|uniref:branched-chain amino acid aminotransferase n=1 Tax=Aquimarina agarivorans TaxID=980584 RepID=UPI000248E953|nr:branched-chain amino acid aminotransferase [Aquimarina agarivorans]